MNHAGMDASAHKAASDLPKEWGWEPFAARLFSGGCFVASVGVLY